MDEQSPSVDITPDVRAQQFMVAYQRQYDFWSSLSQQVAYQLRAALQERGISAIVTNRAKSPQRVLLKAQKILSDNPHADLNISIVDRAGVRVAVYSAEAIAAVGKEISRLFLVVHRLVQDKEKGYRATHYRGYLNCDPFGGDENRFANAMFEIQVSTVMMHAWSEVEHDVIYKELDGTPSAEERRLIAKLNKIARHGDRITARLAIAREERLRGEDNLFLAPEEMIKHIEDRLGEDAPAWLALQVKEMWRYLVAGRCNSPKRADEAIANDLDETPGAADEFASQMFGDSVYGDGYSLFRNRRVPLRTWNIDAEGIWHSVYEDLENTRLDYIKYVAEHPRVRLSGEDEQLLENLHNEFYTNSTDGHFYPRASTEISHLVRAMRKVMEGSVMPEEGGEH